MGHLTVRRLWASAFLAVALSALTGCGGATDSAQDPDPAAGSASSDEPGEAEETVDVPADAPACSEVWVDGQRIARSYQGCVDDAGDYVERDAVGCSSGQRLMIYGDHFWAFQGATVYEAGDTLDTDRDYRAATRRCAA
jgi:hypothetical protein